MYYILKLSTKAFVKLDKNFNLIIVQEPENASRFSTIGSAMKEAGQINTDWDSNIVQIIRVG